jgi:hypothetical protein
VREGVGGVPHWLDVGFHMGLCTSLANFLTFGVGFSNGVYLKFGFLFYSCTYGSVHVCFVHGKRSYFSSS